MKFQETCEKYDEDKYRLNSETAILIINVLAIASDLCSNHCTCFYNDDFFDQISVEDLKDYFHKLSIVWSNIRHDYICVILVHLSHVSIFPSVYWLTYLLILFNKYLHWFHIFFLMISEFLFHSSNSGIFQFPVVLIIFFF